MPNQNTLSTNQTSSKQATRDGFGQGIIELAEQNSQVVGLCADVTESVRLLPFAERFPDRFVEVGVAEQNLVGVAAGLAMTGKIPFAASYAVFSPGRSWDQIRVSVCYSNLNVKIIGAHAGITVGPDGATHQAMEDIAMMRVLPNMTVIVPSDAEEARKATLAIGQMIGPCYLRLGREKVPDCTNKDTPFEIGRALTLRQGTDVTVIACGLMVQASLQAADELATENVSVQVINLHTIKPFDVGSVIEAAERTGALVTAEEHQVAGGLGSAVAEVVSQQRPVPIEMVGMPDQFGESGTATQLLAKYGLQSEAIKQAIYRVIKRKAVHV